MTTDPTLVGVLYFMVTSLFGVVVWGARQLIKGEVIPKQSVEHAAKEWKELLEASKKETAEWKSYYEAERALGATSREIRDSVLAVSKTIDKFLSSLPTDDVNVGG